MFSCRGITPEYGGPAPEQVRRRMNTGCVRPSFALAKAMVSIRPREQVRGGGTGVSLVVTEYRNFRLCDTLRRLNLVDGQGVLARAPIFTVWTEHVSAEVGAPSLMVAPTVSDS